MVKPLKKNERGIALLVVLMGIALMTLIIVDFSTAAALNYLSAANQTNELRAYYLARSAVSVGLGLLAEDSRMDSQNQTPYDGLTDVWATPFPPIEVDGGTVSLSIIDEARKVDLNQLVNPQNGKINLAFAAELERLFTILGVSPQIIPAIADWINPANITTPGGAGMDYYLRLRPPYSTRNGPMPTIGDLRLIKGVDEATFNRLQPFVTVAPEPVVNANTAPPEVLAALLPQLMDDPKLVKELVAARMLMPFTNTTDIANLPGLGTLGQALTQVVTTRSTFFTINALGTFAGSRKLVYSTFRRQGNGTATLMSWQED
ncbi:MAG: type II secretion system minor pseudopilin GspK [Candidatus Binataceae bacterium]